MPASGGKSSGPKPRRCTQARRRVKRAQLAGAAADVLSVGRLPYVPVRIERRDGRFDIAGREGALVVANDVGLLDAGVGLQQRRPGRVRASQRPGLKYTRSSRIRASSSRSAASAKGSSMRPSSPST